MQLEIVHENGRKEVIAVSKTNLVIGRGKNTHIRIDGESISRQHARIEVIDAKVFITDLGSSNGTSINGQRLNAHERTELTSFFPALIGKSATVSLIYAENVVAAKGPAGAPAPIAVQASTATSGDQTRVVQRPSIPSKVDLASKKNKSSLMTWALLLIVLAGGAFWHLRKKMNVPTEATTPSTKAQVPTPVPTASEAERQHHHAKIQGLIAGKPCQTPEEQSICKSIPPTTADGVRIDGDTVYLFFNIAPAIKDYQDKTHQALPPRELMRTSIHLGTIVRSNAHLFMRPLTSYRFFSTVAYAPNPANESEKRLDSSVLIATPTLVSLDEIDVQHAIQHAMQMSSDPVSQGMGPLLWLNEVYD